MEQQMYAGWLGAHPQAVERDGMHARRGHLAAVRLSVHRGAHQRTHRDRRQLLQQQARG